MVDYPDDVGSGGIVADDLVVVVVCYPGNCCNEGFLVHVVVADVGLVRFGCGVCWRSSCPCCWRG